MSVINIKTNYQRVGYAEAMKYITSTVRYSTISQDDLIEYACENSGIPKAQMISAFYAIMQQVQHFLMNGHSLKLGPLGYFFLSADTKAVDEKSEAGVSAVKSLSLKFRQSKKMKELLNSNVVLNNISVSTANMDDAEEDETGGNDGGADDGSSPL
ncbi:MAG: hypothetical protein IJ467_05830 [Bacteroidaceae bacterium]|nr:hypothetical protein [Bacteroidaceae bacterium]